MPRFLSAVATLALLTTMVAPLHAFADDTAPSRPVASPAVAGQPPPTSEPPTALPRVSEPLSAAQSPSAAPAMVLGHPDPAVAPAQAATSTEATSTKATSGQGSSAGLSATVRPVRKQKRMTWMQRFDAANATHDGHLTLEQAKAGYKIVARHFHDIDANHKGYVTENDIRAWHALQRAARHSRAKQDPLRPRPAFDRFAPDQHPPSLNNQTMLTRPIEPEQARIDPPRPPPEN